MSENSRCMVNGLLYISLIYSGFIVAMQFDPAGYTLNVPPPGYSTELDQEILIYPDEVHFLNMRQLTRGGDNAEAYWSFDDGKLVFQSTNPEWDADCDQIFIYDMQKQNDPHYIPEMISTGLGRTTCSYFLPGDSTFIYASTHQYSTACPPKPDRIVFTSIRSGDLELYTMNIDAP